MKESSNRFFKNHTDRRIKEIQERTKNFKAEKIKEKRRDTRTGKRIKKRLDEQVVWKRTKYEKW